MGFMRPGCLIQLDLHSDMRVRVLKERHVPMGSGVARSWRGQPTLALRRLWGLLGRCHFRPCNRRPLVISSKHHLPWLSVNHGHHQLPRVWQKRFRYRLNLSWLWKASTWAFLWGGRRHGMYHFRSRHLHYPLAWYLIEPPLIGRIKLGLIWSGSKHLRLWRCVLRPSTRSFVPKRFHSGGGYLLAHFESA